MSQIQIKTAYEYQITQILKELRKALPVDVWKFKELFREATNCEYYFDIASIPKKEYSVSKNVKVYIHDKEYVDIVCNEEETTIELRNTIYVDDLETNMIVLVHYEV